MVIATVTKEQARAYEQQAWHMGRGIKPILDDVTMQFATDFANVVLKQFVNSYSQVIKVQVVKEIKELAQKKQSEQTDAVATQTVTPTAPQTGRIILTD